MAPEQARFEYVLRLGDHALINGQRLAEWCGHGPFLEEDVGIANTALDLIGRARFLLSYAGDIEGRGRGEDELAYLRDERDWRNLLMFELPNRDFAFTTARQFLADVFHLHLYEALRASRDDRLAAIAAKAYKECVYHVRHTGDWMLRLGDGTAESHDRIRGALEDIWPFTGELFDADAVDEAMHAAGIAPDLGDLRSRWEEKVSALLKQATLQPLPQGVRSLSGRRGIHSEHMGFLLAEMQFVQRAYPGLQW